MVVLHCQGDAFKLKRQKRIILNPLVSSPQVFLKEGVLKKLSRKVMQPRMFFLVNFK